MNSQRKIEVIPYDSKWNEMYEIEAEKITNIFKDILLNIYHIGSTAIPNIKAKPVIDIMAIVKDIEKVDIYNEAMEKLGYEAMGEYGIPERRFFMKGGNNRTHHIHVFQLGNDEIEKHLNFRDYMINHPEEAKKYSDLKEELAKKYTYDINGYIKGKNDFIKNIDRKAREWRKK